MTEIQPPNDPVSALGASGAADLTGEAIKLLSERAEVVLNAVAEGVFCLDREGRTIFVNEAGARMFGYSAREMLGKVQHDLVHHHYADGSPFPVDACPISMSVTDGVTQRVGGTSSGGGTGPRCRSTTPRSRSRRAARSWGPW